MGTTGGQLLLVAGGADVDIKTQEALVAMAKAVASATAALVTNARNVAAKCEDSALQNQVIVAAKQVRGEGERERGGGRREREGERGRDRERERGGGRRERGREEEGERRRIKLKIIKRGMEGRRGCRRRKRNRGCIFTFYSLSFILHYILTLPLSPHRLH